MIQIVKLSFEEKVLNRFEEFVACDNTQPKKNDINLITECSTCDMSLDFNKEARVTLEETLPCPECYVDLKIINLYPIRVEALYDRDIHYTGVG